MKALHKWFTENGEPNRRISRTTVTRYLRMTDWGRSGYKRMMDSIRMSITSGIGERRRRARQRLALAGLRGPGPKSKQAVAVVEPPIVAAAALACEEQAVQWPEQPCPCPVDQPRQLRGSYHRS